MGETELTDLTYEEACDFFGPEIFVHVIDSANREGMPKFRYGTRLRITSGHSVGVEFTVTHMFWCLHTVSWVYYVPGVGSTNIPVYQCESDLEEIE